MEYHKQDDKWKALLCNSIALGPNEGRGTVWVEVNVAELKLANQVAEGIECRLKSPQLTKVDIKKYRQAKSARKKAKLKKKNGGTPSTTTSVGSRAGSNGPTTNANKTKSPATNSTKSAK